MSRQKHGSAPYFQVYLRAPRLVLRSWYDRFDLDGTATGFPQCSYDSVLEQWIKSHDEMARVSKSTGYVYRCKQSQLSQATPDVGYASDIAITGEAQLQNATRDDRTIVA